MAYGADGFSHVTLNSKFPITCKTNKVTYATIDGGCPY